jgi:acetolactate synthase-1/2/3 large subunit
VLIGTRTNQNGTDSWTLLPADARFIHVDAAPEEVGRNYEALRLVGDAKATLSALSSALATCNIQARADARPDLEADIAKALSTWKTFTHAIRTDNRHPIRPERVMYELDALLTPDTIVVADASYSSVWIANYLTCRRAGQRFLTPRGLAGLGWGLPFAIGAKLAAIDRPVVCVAGDGGFAHTWAEIETMKRLKLSIVTIVLNNQILGYQKHAELVQFGGWTDACDFVPVDHAAIARACGVKGIRVERAEDLRAALTAALGGNEPVVLDIITDADAYPPITSFQGKLPSPF